MKVANRNFLQVEMLENEPAVYLSDMELDEDMQQKITEGVIFVFPQPTTANSYTRAVFTGEKDADNYQRDEDNDLGWTVVANCKGKG